MILLDELPMRVCNKVARRLSCDYCGYPLCEAGGDGDHLGPCSQEKIDKFEEMWYNNRKETTNAVFYL